MDSIRIRGGRPLSGTIAIGGAKNAALPLLACGLLTDERLLLTNVPRLADIATMVELLTQHGIAAEPQEDGPRALARRPHHAPRRRPTRSCGKHARLHPGAGAAARPHGRGARLAARRLRHRHPAGGPAPHGLEQMGADIRLDGGYVSAEARRGLHGADIVLPFASVGATENLLMAASIAEGRTVIANAAREPEIDDLAVCLRAMGARIERRRHRRITVDGVERLHGAHHPIVADRIETGTYACAAAITGGDVRLLGGRLAHLGAVVRTLHEAGVEVSEEDGALRVRRAGPCAAWTS